MDYKFVLNGSEIGSIKGLQENRYYLLTLMIAICVCLDCNCFQSAESCEIKSHILKVTREERRST